MFITFLSLIIGGFLLGCAAIFSIIMILTVIMGSYNGYVAVVRTSRDSMVKLTRQPSTIQSLSSTAIEA